MEIVRQQGNHGQFTIEEKVNSFIHAIGVLFAIIFAPFIIYNTSDHPLSNTLSIAIYALCFLMTFTFSTLYHSIVNPKRKSFFKLLDRISIYFFIAATYTPFIIYYMYDSTGIMLLWLMWLLVGAGILFELFLAKRFLFLSVLFYLIMGWMFILVSNRFFRLMPSLIITLIFTGVFFYSFGVIFYVWKKWRFHHAIWHASVLTAALCHFTAVWLTVSNFSL